MRLTVPVSSPSATLFYERTLCLRWSSRVGCVDLSFEYYLSLRRGYTVNFAYTGTDARRESARCVPLLGLYIRG